MYTFPWRNTFILPSLIFDHPNRDLKPAQYYVRQDGQPLRREIFPPRCRFTRPQQAIETAPRLLQNTRASLPLRPRRFRRGNAALFSLRRPLQRRRRASSGHRDSPGDNQNRHQEDGRHRCGGGGSASPRFSRRWSLAVPASPVDPAGDGDRSMQRREAYGDRAEEQKQSKLNPSPTLEHIRRVLCIVFCI